MFSSQSLDALRLRKQFLLLEAELNRVLLREELARVGEHTRWLRDVASLGQGGGSWLTKAAPLAGMLAAGSLTGGAGWLSRGFKLMKLAAVAYPLWKTFTAHRAAKEDHPVAR